MVHRFMPSCSARTVRSLATEAKCLIPGALRTTGESRSLPPGRTRKTNVTILPTFTSTTRSPFRLMVMRSFCIAQKDTDRLDGCEVRVLHLFGQRLDCGCAKQ